MRKFPLHASRFSLPCWYGSVLAACTPNRSIVRSGQFVQTNRSAKDSAPGDVYALAQTTDGFLWLGTMQGLCRGPRYVVWTLKVCLFLALACSCCAAFESDR